MIREHTFVELDKTVHDRENFDCGEKELNEFLRTKALRHMKVGVSRTLVLPGRDVDEQGKRFICAFFTITPSSVNRAPNTRGEGEGGFGR